MRNLYLFLGLSLLTFACGGKSKKSEPIRPTYESCLADGMLYYGGGCHFGSGEKDAQGRYSLLNSATIFDSFGSDKLTVCIAHENFSATKLLSVRTDIEKAFKAWTDEIRDLIPNPNIALSFQTVSHTAGSTADNDLYKVCDQTSVMKVSLRQVIVTDEGEDREHARADTAAMFLNKSTDYDTVLHEMGHIFGLSDIYVEDVWSCKEGFANSVMCDSDWGKPVLDDIESVRRSYCLATDGANTKCFNHDKNSLLSFKPASIERFGRKDQGSYVSCFAKENYFSLGFNIVNYTVRGAMGNEYGGGLFYSTDEKSIRESFTPDAYAVTVQTRLYDKIEDKLSDNPEDVIFTITADTVSLSVPSKGVSISQASIECLYDDKLLNLMKLKGVAVNPKIEARRAYNKLLERVGYRSNDFAMNDKVAFDFTVEEKEDLSKAQVKIFSNDDERTLLHSIPLSELKFESKKDELSYVLGEDGRKIPSNRVTINLNDKVKLKAGDYHIFLDGLKNPREEVFISIAEATVTTPPP